MGGGHGEKLSRKQETAIGCLLAARTIVGAAKACDVSEKTLRNWLKDPAFQTSYRAARRQVVEQAVAQLQQCTAESVTALRRNMKCGQPAIEVKAAVAVLTQAIKAVEMIDFEERLARLETLTAEK